MKICVIMSTYNGEKYIEQQLDSIFTSPQNIFLYVRDDGSKDALFEISILRAYIKSFRFLFYPSILPTIFSSSSQNFRLLLLMP